MSKTLFRVTMDRIDDGVVTKSRTVSDEDRTEAMINLATSDFSPELLVMELLDVIVNELYDGENCNKDPEALANVITCSEALLSHFMVANVDDEASKRVARWKRFLKQNN